MVVTLFSLFPKLESSVGSYALEAVILELNGLREFLDKNSQFSPSSLGAARSVLVPWLLTYQRRTFIVPVTFAKVEEQKFAAPAQ